MTKNQVGTDFDGQSIRVGTRTYYDNTGALKSETSEPIEFSSSITPIWKKKEYTYNAVGLVEDLTDSGADISAVVTRFEYDPLLRWETKRTIAYGNASYSRSVTTKPHPVSGKPMLVQDINGLKSRWKYDAFGRVIAQRKPDGTFVQTEYRSYTDGYAAYYVHNRGSDGAESRVYFDKSGRKIHERKTGSDGRAVYQDYLYDTQGRLVQTSQPYLGGIQAYWNQTLQFDVLGRPVQALAANGAYSDVERLGRLQRTTNSKGYPKEEKKDGFGRTVSITEYKDGVPVVLEYKYDVDGNVRKTVDTTVSPNVEVKSQFDLFGRATQIDDPNRGIWKFDYDVSGNVIRQTDGLGVSTCIAYDLLGRKIKQVGNYHGTLAAAKQQCQGAEADSTTDISQWYYDSATGSALGLVHKVLGDYDRISGNFKYQEEYAYDAVSRPTKVTKLIDGLNYVTGTSYYDATGGASVGKVRTTTYPSGLGVEYRYNAAGSLSQLLNVQTGFLYWKLLSSDAFGHVSMEKFGNGVETINEYNPMDGRIGSSYSAIGLTNQRIFDNEYEFDTLGNLELRRDVIGGAQETFSYDSLNRVDSSTLSYSVSGQTVSKSFDYQYSLNGNLKSRPEISTTTFSYGSPSSSCATVFAGPHAITAVGSTIYCYDKNGSLVKRGSDVFQYNSFGSATFLTKGSNSSRFQYSPGQERYKRVDVFAGAQTTTVYAGAYEKVVAGSNVKEKHYIGGVALVTIENGFNQTTAYLHKDHLGSVIGVTDQNGTVTERFSYDPWGRRRAGSWAPLDATNLNSLITSLYPKVVASQGYTGQEMLDGVSLVHMNGRIYDPSTGHMISADPVTSHPKNMQSFNRYSYVMNNPMRLVDPSGYSSEDIYADNFYGIGFDSNGGFSFNFSNSEPDDSDIYSPVMDYTPPLVDQFNTAFRNPSEFYYGTELTKNWYHSVDLSYGTYQYSDAYWDGFVGGSMTTSFISTAALAYSADAWYRSMSFGDVAPLGYTMLRFAGVAVGVMFPNTNMVTDAEEQEQLRLDRFIATSLSAVGISYNEVLYRGERPSMGPERVFALGIAPKGTNMDLLAATQSNTVGSYYVSTSRYMSVALDFAGGMTKRNGYVYVIGTERGIDVNMVLGDSSPHPYQAEVAIPGGIFPNEVLGVFPVVRGELSGVFIPNPASGF